MKKRFTLTLVIAFAVLLAACAPTSTPAAAAEEIPSATPEPTPTATVIPAKTLVVVSNDSGTWQLYFIGSDGTGMTRVTANSLIEGTFDYSADQSRIAFETYLEAEQNSEIYVMQSDGSNPARLTNRSQNDWGPVWSPDGSKIVFQSNLGDNNYEILVMNADGSNIINLSNNSGLDTYPSWSPDGTRVAYSSGGRQRCNRGYLFPSSNDSSIKIINADGQREIHPAHPGWRQEWCQPAVVPGRQSTPLWLRRCDQPK